MLSSFEVWALVLARALIGITMSGCYVTCPIYTKEISEDSIRGALGCLVGIMYDFSETSEKKKISVKIQLI